MGDSLKEKMDKVEGVAYYRIEAYVSNLFLFYFVGRFRKQGSVLN